MGWHWAKTDWTVEDANIVARIARNFAEHGVLAYNVGELVSTATAPIYALLLGLGACVGADPIVLAKLLGIAAVLATGFVLRRAAELVVGPMLGNLAPALFLIHPQTAAFATCGLETPEYALACLACLYSSVVGKHSAALWLGVIATLLRPDGAIALLLAGGMLLWDRRDPKAWIRAAWGPGLLLALYLCVHGAVYGTLVPHTLIAKANVYRIQPFANAPYYLRELWSDGGAFNKVLWLLALPGLALCARRAPRLWLLVGWYCAYHLAFMLRAPLFEWYRVPPLGVRCLMASLALAYVIELASRGSFRGLPGARLSAALVLVPVLALALRAQDKSIERRRLEQAYNVAVLRAVGAWMAAHTRPSDVLFTESLGYIGAGCSNPVVDWPGLATRAIPDLVANQPARVGFDTVIRTYAPAWLALRQNEWERLAGDLRESYDVAARFPAPSSQQSMLIAGTRQARSRP